MTSRDLARRTLLTGAAGAATAGAAAGAGAPAAARTPRGPRGPGPRLRWLGTTGFHVEVGGAAVLVDPYLTRFETGLAAGRFDPTTALRVDPAAIDAALGDLPGVVETVLVTHAHWDHFNDVPTIVTRDGARLVGAETTVHLATAMGAPGGIAVRGGEVLDFGTHVVEVVSSLHSRGATWTVLFPGRLDQPPATAPQTIADLPEGDTLAFVVSARQGPRTLVLGGSDFKARELAGTRPDVAAVPVPSSDATFDYLPRLLECLDRPRVVIATHWDDFERPLTNPPQATPALRARLEAFQRDVRRLSPRTRVVVPDYLAPIRV